MEWLVTIHSYWRYLVLIVAIITLVLTIMAYLGSRPWDMLTERFTLVFTIVLDIQLVIGILVWILADYERGLYLSFIHPIMMIVAVALAHVGRVRAGRVTESRAKGAQATLFFVASLVIILLAIPFASWHL